MNAQEALAAKRELRESEWRALVAIGSIGRDGWPVSVRETQRYLGHAGTSAVHYAIKSLEQRGLLERNPRWGSGRGGWRLTDDGAAVFNA